MKDILDALRSAQEELERRWDPFVLLGLFRREGEDSWDLVLSAPRMQSIADEGYTAMLHGIRRAMPSGWRSTIGVIHPIPSDADFIRTVAGRAAHEGERLSEFTFDGMTIEEGIVLSVRLPDAQSIAA